MHRIFNRGAVLSIAAVALLAGGCASTEDVQKAQSTADQALSTAQQAQQAAQAAQQSADQNKSEINQLNQRVQDLEAKHTRGERG